MLALDAAGATKKGERERGLSELERDKFEDMLRGLTAEREAVCDVSARLVEDGVKCGAYPGTC